MCGRLVVCVLGCGSIGVCLFSFFGCFCWAFLFGCFLGLVGWFVVVMCVCVGACSGCLRVCLFVCVCVRVFVRACASACFRSFLGAPVVG